MPSEGLTKILSFLVLGGTIIAVTALFVKDQAKPHPYAAWLTCGVGLSLFMLLFGTFFFEDQSKLDSTVLNFYDEAGCIVEVYRNVQIQEAEDGHIKFVHDGVEYICDGRPYKIAYQKD